MDEIFNLKTPYLPSLPTLPLNNEDEEDAKPAAADVAQFQLSLSSPGFEISDVRRKNARGALICMAVGCDKNAQSKSNANNIRGLCRVHHNTWLISTGQIESWDCLCGNKVSVDSERCGLCHRWKNRKSLPKKEVASLASPARSTKKKKGGNGSSTKLVKNVPPGVEISRKRETNQNGRSLCKVVGCIKLDQSSNDGFCRMHFNMFSAPGIGCVSVAISSWTCVCGESISESKKRCGKCNKWKGGKREAYATAPSSSSKKPRLSNSNESSNDTAEDPWTCTCGNLVPATKSRCGSCHHWRGGKRRGGWKIKSNYNAGSDCGIDWTQDWSCCEKAISAAKKRCGVCHGWRGGKRIASTAKMTAPLPSPADTLPAWECSNCQVLNPSAEVKCASCFVWKDGSYAMPANLSEVQGRNNIKEEQDYSATEFI